MKAITVELSTVFGPMEVDAWSSETPGLVVNRGVGLDGEPSPNWSVTHARSGCAVGMRPDPESAMKLAADIGGSIDWTVSGAEVREQLGTTHREVCRRLGVDLGDMRGQKCGPEHLAR